MKAKNKLVKLEERVGYRATQARCRLSNSLRLLSYVHEATATRVGRTVITNWQDFSPRTLTRDLR